MERIGKGLGVAALLNGRAKQVTQKVVRALVKALPQAQILVSGDLEQAKRHAARIAAAKPWLVLSGGGDGAIVKLLNLLRGAGLTPFPTVGVLRLGTGNGWARVSGAPPYFKLVHKLSKLPRELPTTPYDLVEVENTLCHFTGVGWDARLLNDYLRNLDKRSSQLVGATLATRIHKGLGGYLYSLVRLTVPEEWAQLRERGQPRVRIENLGAAASTLSVNGACVPILGSEAGGERSVLYDGVCNVGCAGTTEEWGYGFRAFPFARSAPGKINLRVYDRPVLEATANMFKLWRGTFPQAGMHDYFVDRARFVFDRPMPFQIGGDGEGVRESIEVRVADQTVPIVEWGAALSRL